MKPIGRLGVPVVGLFSNKHSVRLTQSPLADRWAQINPRQSQIVELRFFSCLPIEDTSDFLGVSPASAKRSWTNDRTWLVREMNRSEASWL
jgi:DNA-directed RNA polymerase specialized sigma24 family protein